MVIFYNTFNIFNMGITERKEREKEFRRQAIIDAAEKVFFAKGYDNSTMEDIAGMAELSKGTLYLYFQSKDELHFEIMDRGNRLMLEFMEKSIDPEKSGLENLRRLGEAFVNFSNDCPDYFKAMIFFNSRDVEQQKLNSEKLKKFLEGRSSISLLSETIASGIKDGSIRKDLSATHLTTLLWSQMMGILVMYSTKKSAFEYRNISREELVGLHLDLMSDGLRPKQMEGESHV